MEKNIALNIIALYKETLEAQGVKVDRIILNESWTSQKLELFDGIGIVVISEDFRGKAYSERIDEQWMSMCQMFNPVKAVAMTPEEWKWSTTKVNRFIEGEVVYNQCLAH